jgi:LacI family transcriptional regulator
MTDRLKGYQSAISQNHLNPHMFQVKFHNIAEEEAYIKILDFFSANPDFDGVFFATNYLAFEGLEVLGNLGMDVPGQVKVVSFDDHYFFNLYKPKISAIEQPLELIADKLMEAILYQLNEPELNGNSKHFILPNRLNTRESSAF